MISALFAANSPLDSVHPETPSPLAGVGDLRRCVVHHKHLGIEGFRRPEEWADYLEISELLRLLEVFCKQIPTFRNLGRRDDQGIPSRKVVTILDRPACLNHPGINR